MTSKNYLILQQKITLLRRQIEYYDDQYFNHNNSVITDYQYDCLVEQLESLEKQLANVGDSSTNKILEKHLSIFPKYIHSVPMLSLKKTYSISDIDDFLDKIEKKYQHSTYCCELKIDGISVNIHYEHGVFKSISTRGDGHIGDNITSNRILMTNIPDNINIDDVVDIRGEAFMTYDTFKDLDYEASNPRNAASGLLKSLNPNPKYKINVYTYSIINTALQSQIEVLNQLRQWDMPVCQFYKYCRDRQDIYDYISHWENARKNLNFPTDGIVIKINELVKYEQLGCTAKAPRWAIAYKYKPECAITKLKYVDYQVGRTGIITPVAHFDKVCLSGSTVQCATLHNNMVLQQLDLHEGDNIVVEKTGEIIPKIINVDKSQRVPGAPKVIFPNICPICKTPVKYINDLCFCVNDNCESRLWGRIIHFASRQAMNIKALGEKTIKNLLKYKIINDISDLYKLTEFDVIGIPGFGQKSAINLISSIEQSKHRPYSAVLFALGIPNIGITIAQYISKNYSIDELMTVPIDELINKKFIGNAIAIDIKNFLTKDENVRIIQALQRYGLNFSKNS